MYTEQGCTTLPREMHACCKVAMHIQRLYDIMQFSNSKDAHLSVSALLLRTAHADAAFIKSAAEIRDPAPAA